MDTPFATTTTGSMAGLLHPLIPLTAILVLLRRLARSTRPSTTHLCQSPMLLVLALLVTLVFPRGILTMLARWYRIDPARAELPLLAASQFGIVAVTGSVVARLLRKLRVGSSRMVVDGLRYRQQEECPTPSSHTRSASSRHEDGTYAVHRGVSKWRLHAPYASHLVVYLGLLLTCSCVLAYVVLGARVPIALHLVSLTLVEAYLLLATTLAWIRVLLRPMGGTPVSVETRSQLLWLVPLPVILAPAAIAPQMFNLLHDGALSDAAMGSDGSAVIAYAAWMTVTGMWETWTVLLLCADDIIGDLGWVARVSTYLDFVPEAQFASLSGYAHETESRGETVTTSVTTPLGAWYDKSGPTQMGTRPYDHRASIPGDDGVDMIVAGGGRKVTLRDWSTMIEMPHPP